jgi:hypothetical protein
MQTEDEMTELTGNPLIPEIPDFATLSLPYMASNTRSAWKSTIIYYLGLIHIKAGFDRNGQDYDIHEISDFAILGLPTASNTRKHPMIALKSQARCITTDSIVFLNKKNLALHAN